ncbi:MAG: alpha-amylase family glycosyl hydrolase [Phycisphaerales bacterium]
MLPINEFAGDFSWGYNPADPYSVESIYGGMNEYKRFINEAHARGLAVIQDVVHNHYGPSDLEMWQFDGWQQNNKGGIFFYQDFRSSTPWGDTRPDYGRGEVRTFIRDNIMSWLQEFRVDGLRWDSTVNIRNTNNGMGSDIPDGWSLMQYCNNEIDASQGWKISIAEDLQNNDFITRTTGAGGAGFDSQWDARFVHPIRDAIITGTDSNRNMFSVRDAISAYYNGSATQRVIYTESHDEVANGKSRVPEEIWPGNAGSWASKKRSTLGAGLVMTSPGIPMIFQGQEVLEDGFFADTDPVDWTKATTYAGIQTMYRDLIRLRRNWFDTTRGLRGNNTNVHHINNKVIAYHRWQNGGARDDVIIVANFGNASYNSYNIGFPRAGTWRVRFNSDWNGYSSDFANTNSYDTTAFSGAKDGMGFNGNIGIGPYSIIIMSQDN